MILKIIYVIGFVYASLSSVECLPFLLQEKCAHNTYPPTGSPEIPHYVVNLDLPPEQRWQQIGKEKSALIANIMTTFKKVLLSMSSEFQHVIDFIDRSMAILVETLPMPYRAEIKGLSTASGLNLGEMLFYNIAYEIFAWCTSIIAQTPNGTLYHARNLDFGSHVGWDPKKHTWKLSEALRSAVITVDWQRKNKTVFKSVNYAGYVGVLTAVKPRTFTFSMNERRTIDGGYIGIIKWLLGDRSSRWMAFLTRQTLEVATSYQQAKHLLTNTTMVAPAYFILGGTEPHEACVITRSREKTVDVWEIGTRGSTWYILETNYDNWKPPPVTDDRRALANRCMRNMTQKNVGFAGLFDVLSSKPVLNAATTYTTLMQVDSGSMETYVQYSTE